MEIKKLEYNTNMSIPQLFERVYTILSGEKFLNKSGLGGNKPIFIQPYDIKKQLEVDEQINILLKRMNSAGIPIASFDLYVILIDILKEKKTLDKIIQLEKSFSKNEFKKHLQSSLSVNDTIIPYIREKTREKEHKIILMYGFDKAYPVISIVPILSNIQTVLNYEPIVFIYPGVYDNYSLNLFGCINEDNEYRAFNLNNYN